MSCTCQSCGSKYNIDLSIPNRLWEKITPSKNNPEGGLLCGSCIMSKLEGLELIGVLHVGKFRLLEQTPTRKGILERDT